MDVISVLEPTTEEVQDVLHNWPKSLLESTSWRQKSFIHLFTYSISNHSSNACSVPHNKPGSGTKGMTNITSLALKDLGPYQRLQFVLGDVSWNDFSKYYLL